MYTVLLTDDEKAVTDALLTNIPWASLGVETVLTASDGAEAWHLIRSRQIDLLITDIKMPHMDGLELLKKIRSDSLDIHCILLTAFGEFDYAMQALKLGVDNYLMKPLQFDELTSTIETALDNIYISRKSRDTLFYENILRRWITGSISMDELGERASFTSLNIYQAQYCVIALKKKSASFSASGFGSLFASLLPENLDSSFVWDNHGNFLILVGGNSFSSEQIAHFLEQAAKQLSIPELADIALGCIVHDRKDVHKSYESASELLAAPHTAPITYCETPTAPSPDAALPLPQANFSPVVKRALEYIETHFSESVSIKEFCNIVNINAAYLGYLFKKETGMYFNNYLNEYRIRQAIRMLCQTGDKIGNIALKSGYSTTSHFITTFKKSTGFSPLKYRELYSGKQHE